jgi:N-hydroxyarylamine O-acetyltransferase
MREFKFDQEAYLQRISYTKEVKVTIECLKDIHYAQLFTIPFENFDIFLNRAIELEPEKLFHKMVRHKRGGYCFELNGLFLMVLQSFGFDARAILGRVHVPGPPTGRGHQLSLITFQGNQWIADVGFGGDTPRAPIPLVLNQPTTNYGQSVRLVESEHYGIMLQIKKDAIWTDLYSFDLGYVCPGDIEYGNHYSSTSPKSFFVIARVAALPVKDGVITLINNTLNKTLGGKEIQIQLEEDQTYIDSLETHFGIKLDAPYDELKPFTE